MKGIEGRKASERGSRRKSGYIELVYVNQTYQNDCREETSRLCRIQRLIDIVLSLLATYMWVEENSYKLDILYNFQVPLREERRFYHIYIFSRLLFMFIIFHIICFMDREQDDIYKGKWKKKIRDKTNLLLKY